MYRRIPIVALCAAGVAAACSDSPQSTAPAVRTLEAGASASNAPWASEKFVAIGTSISMGWLSNGVYSGSQVQGWPALMRFGASDRISLPLIQPPGCQSPLLAPLGANMRLSGEPFSGSTVCAPNVPGTQLPTQNVAWAGAIAAYALQVTPENAGPLYPWVSRVLPPGATQVSAALSQQPTLVSIELGGNDVLNATSGVIAFGVDVVPVPFFITAFDAVLDAVGSAGPKAIVFGMPLNGRNLPSMRRGEEIWADRAEFAALHVDVSPDCAGSANYINVSLKSIVMVLTGAYTSAHGLPNPVYSCANVPSATFDNPDFVLTAADMDLLESMLAQMAAHAKEQAATRGYAFVSLGELYDRADLKPPVYSVVTQLTSAYPYGPYISLDGVHPGPLGHVVLARAAAKALNKTYPGIAAHAADSPVASLANELVEPAPSPLALEWAKRFAIEHQGDKLPRCLMPGGCTIGPLGGGPVLR
ncbi:MAG TPA: SGNH/GDSL hydrolase family protein [Gemmatimonadaceae bacterium]|nr:SGNH/GDSL hydrolase family protein [Gemmatimonadaceae bacterium]